jgi:hypothetical protein
MDKNGCKRKQGEKLYFSPCLTFFVFCKTISLERLILFPADNPLVA